MSEEEILKECTELAENEHHELGDCWDEEYSSSAIFGLIMLYKQTKKELNNLKEIEQLHQEENGKLRVEFEKVYEDNLTLVKELEEEKEKNKELQKYEEAYKLLSYGLNNYISKDRIKAEMEDIIDYFEYANATSEDMEFLEKKKKEILEEK